jgi:hypothetical protein
MLFHVYAASRPNPRPRIYFVACIHGRSLGFLQHAPDDSHDQDRQCVSRIFVESLRAQELSQHIFSSYPDVSRTEFQFCCLRIRFVSQVVCSHSVDRGDSWTFLVTFFDDIYKNKHRRCLFLFRRLFAVVNELLNKNKHLRFSLDGPRSACWYLYF